MKIEQKLLTPNKYSRPRTKLNAVKGIVIHWVANPNTSALSNRNFFENRKAGKTNYGSAHYIVGLKGEIIQCLPDNEVGYHVGSNVYTSHALKRLGSYPNATTIGIEMTHIDWNGRFSKETYDATLELAVSLLKKYKLTENDLWLHKTVVGWKDCAKWFVDNPAEWTKFKNLAGQKLRGTANLNPEVDTKDMVVIESDARGMYKIQSGDTFWSLAEALDVSVDIIKRLNPNVDEKNLKVGQEIRIKEVGVFEHTVAKGDTLWAIANKYGTTVDKLRQLNKGLEVTSLQVGAKILYSEEAKQMIKPTRPTASKPAPVKDNPEVKIGRITGNVWLHTKADLTAGTRDRVLETGESYRVYGEKNNMYDLGSGFVAKQFVEIVGTVGKIDLPNVVLRRNDRGANVVAVQRALNQLKFSVGVEDGIFGAKTENALKKFQLLHAKPVDGIYGSKTEKAMEALLNK